MRVVAKQSRLEIATPAGGGLAMTEGVGLPFGRLAMTEGVGLPFGRLAMIKKKVPKFPNPQGISGNYSEVIPVDYFFVAFIAEYLLYFL